MTSTDVARAAGVSQAAVSRAFTPGAPIASKTRDVIIDVARTLGYEPRPSVRTPADVGMPAIALVMSDVTNPFFPELLLSFSVRLRARGYVVEMHCATPDVDVNTILSGLFRHQVTGVVVTSAVWAQDVAQACGAAGVPVVLFNRSVPIPDVSTVSCDNYAAARVVADLFADTGCSRIAYMAGREDTSSSRDRERGLEEGLAARGISLFAREAGRFNYEDAGNAMRRLLSAKVRPDAVFCANDMMAMAVVDALARENGLRIPEDVSVVGFDDIAMASWSAYRLTTVRQRLDTMIDEAVDLLERLAVDPRSAGLSRLVPGQLVERASTRARPPASTETGLDRRQKSGKRAPVAARKAEIMP